MLTVESAIRPWSKILVVITEDWFALSHFIPLLKELRALAGTVVVATRSSGRIGELHALGVKTCELDMLRGSLRVSEIKAVRQDLAQLIDMERPDAVHAIAMQPMVMTSLALARGGHRPAAVILHLTGRGYLGYARSPLAHLLRGLAHAALRRCTRTCNAWLVGENSDDVGEMVAARVAVPDRTGILPGAGVDPARFPQLPAPRNDVPRAAYAASPSGSTSTATPIRAAARPSRASSWSVGTGSRGSSGMAARPTWWACGAPRTSPSCRRLAATACRVQCWRPPLAAVRSSPPTWPAAASSCVPVWKA